MSPRYWLNLVLGGNWPRDIEWWWKWCNGNTLVVHSSIPRSITQNGVGTKLRCCPHLRCRPHTALLPSYCAVALNLRHLNCHAASFQSQVQNSFLISIISLQDSCKISWRRSYCLTGVGLSLPGISTKRVKWIFWVIQADTDYLVEAILNMGSLSLGLLFFWPDIIFDNLKSAWAGCLMEHLRLRTSLSIWSVHDFLPLLASVIRTSDR